MLPSASRYMTLAECLLVMATFAGTLTITAVLTTPNLPGLVNILLGYASALFLSSITAIFPIFLFLQRFSDDDVPINWHYAFVKGWLAFSALTTFAAFVILLVALETFISRAAFILGAALVGVNVLTLAVISLWNLYTVWHGRML